MKNIETIKFGTYDVPAISDTSLSANYTAPNSLPKDVMKKISFGEVAIDKKSSKEADDFNKLLKGVVSVPKPKK